VKWKGWIKSCDLDLGVLMTDDKGILIFYNEGQATICFVKDYNILKRSIPAFLSPKNNQRFADGTHYSFASIIRSQVCE
jgi:hypothetical protein